VVVLLVARSPERNADQIQNCHHPGASILIKSTEKNKKYTKIHRTFMSLLVISFLDEDIKTLYKTFFGIAKQNSFLNVYKQF
jgi:hypothetical protein